MPDPVNPKYKALIDLIMDDKKYTPGKLASMVSELTSDELAALDTKGFIHSQLQEELEKDPKSYRLKQAMEQIENAPGNKHSSVEASKKPMPFNMAGSARSDEELVASMQFIKEKNGALTLSHEGMNDSEFDRACDWLEKETGIKPIGATEGHIPDSDRKGRGVSGNAESRMRDAKARASTKSNLQREENRAAKEQQKKDLADLEAQKLKEQESATKPEPVASKPVEEAPKVEVKTETPKTEVPKVEAKTETPKPEAPKVEVKAETPKLEVPKADIPKPTGQFDPTLHNPPGTNYAYSRPANTGATVEASKTEVPKAETKIETPKVEVKTDADPVKLASRPYTSTTTPRPVLSSAAELPTVTPIPGSVTDMSVTSASTVKADETPKPLVTGQAGPTTPAVSTTAQANRVETGPSSELFGFDSELGSESDGAHLQGSPEPTKPAPGTLGADDAILGHTNLDGTPPPSPAISATGSTAPVTGSGGASSTVTTITSTTTETRPPHVPLATGQSSQLFEFGSELGSESDGAHLQGSPEPTKPAPGTLGADDAILGHTNLDGTPPSSPGSSTNSPETDTGGPTTPNSGAHSTDVPYRLTQPPEQTNTNTGGAGQKPERPYRLTQPREQNSPDVGTHNTGGNGGQRTDYRLTSPRENGPNNSVSNTSTGATMTNPYGSTTVTGGSSNVNSAVNTASNTSTATATMEMTSEVAIAPASAPVSTDPKLGGSVATHSQDAVLPAEKPAAKTKAAPSKIQVPLDGYVNDANGGSMAAPQSTKPKVDVPLDTYNAENGGRVATSNHDVDVPRTHSSANVDTPHHNNIPSQAGKIKNAVAYGEQAKVLAELTAKGVAALSKTPPDMEAAVANFGAVAEMVGGEAFQQKYMPMLEKKGIQIGEKILEKLAPKLAAKAASVFMKVSGIDETGAGILLDFAVQLAFAAPEIAAAGGLALTAGIEYLKGDKGALDKMGLAGRQAAYAALAAVDGSLMVSDLAHQFAEKTNDEEMALAKKEHRKPLLIDDPVYEQTLRDRAKQNAEMKISWAEYQKDPEKHNREGAVVVPDATSAVSRPQKPTIGKVDIDHQSDLLTGALSNNKMDASVTNLIPQMEKGGWGGRIEDKNGNKHIELQEIKDTFAKHKITFEQVDANNDGIISGKEMEKALYALPKANKPAMEK